ncbi:copper resistance protein B (plasmid) [Sphingomonas sp. AAP5]|uniref:copper resistance protein B n=1 Tax=Sphingomonas sp. AAP5 TaxID=1523415 RepID=UPI0010575C2C|nr:copper resistance protein B [Sphingomonas sp. AAP5]QBM78223.1 copper resistance protein B [Sphingomonas sp. AAP5]
MKALLLAGIGALVVGVAPATAQTMDHSMMPGMSMPGMKMPAKTPAAKPKPAARKIPAKKATLRKAPTKHPVAPVADPHAGHAMPGMDMGGAKPADPHAGHDMSGMQGMAPSPAPVTIEGEHAGHDMSAMPGMQMAPGQPTQHDMAAMPGTAAPVGTDLKPGNAPAPAPAAGLAASRYYSEAAMSVANRDLRREHGGMTYYQVLFNLAEYQARKGGDGYRWDGEAWIGGDINRLTLKSEGEGTFGKPLEAAEVQALYSRALDPYWNLQAGVRYDFKPNPSRTYATVGIEGLAPYWFDVEGALFLSDKGDVLGRAEAWYDERVTQFFVLQPRVEANFSAQDVQRDGIGSGLTDLELGLRLRYEKSREFAPYIGVSWERQFGDTARFTRARGDDTGGFSFVAGVRTWF